MQLLKKYMFRGKVADEPNEWVYGYLMNDNIIYQPRETKVSNCCGIGMFSIITDTVGLCTGKVDCRKTLIFEGDIFKDLTSNRFYEVKFNGQEFLAVDNVDGELYLLSSFRSAEITVIGKVYEVE